MDNHKLLIYSNEIMKRHWDDALRYFLNQPKDLEIDFCILEPKESINDPFTKYLEFLPDIVLTSFCDYDYDSSELDLNENTFKSPELERILHSRRESELLASLEKHPFALSFVKAVASYESRMHKRIRPNTKYVLFNITTQRFDAEKSSNILIFDGIPTYINVPPLIGDCIEDLSKKR